MSSQGGLLGSSFLPEMLFLKTHSLSSEKPSSWKGHLLVLKVTVPAKLTFSQPRDRRNRNVPASSWKCIPQPHLLQPWAIHITPGCFSIPGALHCRAGHAISAESCSNFGYSESVSTVRCLLYYATMFLECLLSWIYCLHPTPTSRISKPKPKCDGIWR